MKLYNVEPNRFLSLRLAGPRLTQQLVDVIGHSAEPGGKQAQQSRYA